MFVYTWLSFCAHQEPLIFFAFLGGFLGSLFGFIFNPFVWRFMSASLGLSFGMLGGALVGCDRLGAQNRARDLFLERLANKNQ